MNLKVLMRYLIACFLASVICMVIGKHYIDNINNSSILTLIMKGIVFVFFISLGTGLFLANYYGIGTAIMVNVIIYYLTMTVIVSSKFFKTGVSGPNIYLDFTLISGFYLLLLVNIYRIAYQISTQSEPELIDLTKYTGVKNKLGFLINTIEKLIYKLNIITVPLLYLILIAFTILTFSAVYEAYNIVHGVSAFLYNNPSHKVTDQVGSWDLLYFSSTTFFTVGYGDIVPVSNLIKAIAQVEMFIGYTLSIIYLPILFLVFGNRLNLKKL